MSQQLLLEAARSLGIQAKVLNPHGLTLFVQDNRRLLLYKLRFPCNHATAVFLSQNKYHTNRLLKAAGLPVPQLYFCRRLDQAKKYAQKIGYPVVVKPVKSRGGNLVFAHLQTEKELTAAVNRLLQLRPAFVLEKHHFGDEHRLLVLGDQVIGCVKRTPLTLVGDGRSTVRQLLDQLSRTRQKPVKLDTEVRAHLKKHHLTPDSVLPKNKSVQLRQRSNYSLGGQTTTVSPQTLHPELRKIAVKAAQTLELKIAGVDMMIKDIHQPPKDNAVILELNSSPGLALHHFPTHGQPQPVAPLILRYLLHTSL